MNNSRDVSLPNKLTWFICLPLSKSSIQSSKSSDIWNNLPNRLPISTNLDCDVFERPHETAPKRNAKLKSVDVFKHNNSPVEIALSVGLKEIAPIYKADVEHGW